MEFFFNKGSGSNLTIPAGKLKKEKGTKKQVAESQKEKLSKKESQKEIKVVMPANSGYSFFFFLIGNSGYSKPALSLSALHLIEKQRPGLDGILGRLLFYYVPRFLWKPEIATLSGLSNKHKVKKNSSCVCIAIQLYFFLKGKIKFRIF